MEDEKERTQKLDEIRAKFEESWSQFMNPQDKDTSIKEYEQVQRLRDLWSRNIMTWGQVFVPLGAAIIAFFALQGGAGTGAPNFVLLMLGWGLFTICTVYWRWVVHHIDEQIVGLYPVMLRLESINNWDIHTRYFFNNLAKRSRDYLCHQLGLEHWTNDYDEFVEETRRQGRDQYGSLLSVWREYGYNSVSDRGHKIQDIAVFIVVVLLLILVLWIRADILALLSIFLFALLIPWGKHRGWWIIDTAQLWSSIRRLINSYAQSCTKAIIEAVRTGGKGKERLSSAIKKLRVQFQHSTQK